MDCDWELSQSFTSDGQGIRVSCVLPCEEGRSDGNWYRLVTGSQGGSLCEFAVPSGDLRPIEYQHDHAVTALASFVLDSSSGDSNDSSKNYYATGCKDSIVRVFDASSHAFIYALKGHEKAVTSMMFAGPHYLITGSWDGTAKVWNLSNRSLVANLEGHENTVSVCVLSYSDDTLRIATGSAGVAQNNAVSDHSMRIWEVNPSTGEAKQLVKVSNDHEGPIRDLACSGAELASCSNDGTVRLRSPETAESLATLVFAPNGGQSQHPPMLLSVASLSSNGGYAASAEDGHVVVWGADNNAQILRHASCVWSVLALPNGDFATSCDDGTLRIFTTAQERTASEQERQAFLTQAKEALEKRSNGPSADEVAKLPKWEMNALTKGRSEGQVQVFNKSGVAIAAQWSDASQTWIEVGQVMGSSEDSGAIEGVKYDHVLPIEVDAEGGSVAKLKIGYNTGENPFVAAQRFIDDHVLPQHHLSDIADYIQKRIGNAAPTLGIETSATGGSSSVQALLLEHLPSNVGYKCFELSTKNASTSMEKMMGKIQQFEKSNEKVVAQVQSLTQTLLATNKYHAAKFTDEELSVICQMLTWPSEQAFPALDLARMIVLVADSATKQRASYWNNVIQLVVQQSEQVTESDGTASVAIPLLSLRLFSNCFKGGPGSLNAISSNLESVLDCTESHALSKNKNIRLSAATVLLNTATLLHSSGDTESSESSLRVVFIVGVMLQSGLYEGEAMVRMLLALGTVVLGSTEAQDAAKSLNLTTKVEPAAHSHGEKAQAVAKEIYSILI